MKNLINKNKICLIRKKSPKKERKKTGQRLILEKILDDEKLSKTNKRYQSTDFKSPTLKVVKINLKFFLSHTPKNG